MRPAGDNGVLGSGLGGTFPDSCIPMECSPAVREKKQAPSKLPFYIHIQGYTLVSTKLKFSSAFASIERAYSAKAHGEGE